MNNSFTTPSGTKTIIDHLVVILKDVNFATGILDRQARVITKVDLLKPVSFKLQVHRNLSFQNDKSIPEINVEAELPIIDVKIFLQNFLYIG